MSLSTLLVVALLSLFSLGALAQGDGSVEEPVEATSQEISQPESEASKDSSGLEDKVEQLEQEMKLTQLHRRTTDWTVLATISPLDTWIPMKWGLSASYNPDASASWELEYLRGKISYGVLVEDIGSISDQRISFLRRSYSQRNSFSFVYGIFYNSLEASLGSEYLATVSGNPSAYETIKVETLGLSWGIGNRWQTKGGFVWSFDWFVLNVPVAVLESDASFLKASSNESLKQDIRDALEFFEDYPTFAILKTQLGMSF